MFEHTLNDISAALFQLLADVAQDFIVYWILAHNQVNLAANLIRQILRCRFQVSDIVARVALQQLERILHNQLTDVLEGPYFLWVVVDNDSLERVKEQTHSYVAIRLFF